MADKPSKALVLYGDGLARVVDTSHTHIHSLASVASCGFLSLPHAPPGLSLFLSLIRQTVSVIISIVSSDCVGDPLIGTSVDQNWAGSDLDFYESLVIPLIRDPDHSDKDGILDFSCIIWIFSRATLPALFAILLLEYLHAGVLFNCCRNREGEDSSRVLPFAGCFRSLFYCCERYILLYSLLNHLFFFFIDR